MEQLSDDDEIHYYITSPNTVIDSQGISSTPETLIKSAIISQGKSINSFSKQFFMEV